MTPQTHDDPENERGLTQVIMIVKYVLSHNDRSSNSIEVANKYCGMYQPCMTEQQGSVPYKPAASENQPSAYAKTKAQIICAGTAGFLMRRPIIMGDMDLDR